MDGLRSARRVRVSLAVGAAALVAASGAAASGRPAKPSAGAVAERKVLALLSQRWGAHSMPQLVNRRTRLPWNNVRALCRRPALRPDRFGKGGLLCIVRPAGHSRARLYASYLPLLHGGTRIRLVSFTAGRHQASAKKPNARVGRPRPQRSEALAKVR
jgi:hypothetical protein